MINNSTTGGKGMEVTPIAVYMWEKIKQYNLIVTGSAENNNGKSIKRCIHYSGISHLEWR